MTMCALPLGLSTLTLSLYSPAQVAQHSQQAEFSHAGAEPHDHLWPAPQACEPALHTMPLSPSVARKQSTTQPSMAL